MTSWDTVGRFHHDFCSFLFWQYMGSIWGSVIQKHFVRNIQSNYASCSIKKDFWEVGGAPKRSQFTTSSQTNAHLIPTEGLLKPATTVLCVLQGCLWMGSFLVGTIGWLALWWTRLKCLFWVVPSKQTNQGCVPAFTIGCSLQCQSQMYQSPLNATERHYNITQALVLAVLKTSQQSRWWRCPYLGTDFGLVVSVATIVACAAATATATAVAVVVWAGISVFVYSVQEPEKEFQGIVLGVPSKLRAVLCHDTLKREQTLISHFGRNIWSHYMVALWQNGATMITLSLSFVSENCFSWGH